MRRFLLRAGLIVAAPVALQVPAVSARQASVCHSDTEAVPSGPRPRTVDIELNGPSDQARTRQSHLASRRATGR